MNFCYVRETFRNLNFIRFGEGLLNTNYGSQAKNKQIATKL